MAYVVPPLAILTPEDVGKPAPHTLAGVRGAFARHDDFLAHQHDDVGSVRSGVLDVLLDVVVAAAVIAFSIRIAFPPKTG